MTDYRITIRGDHTELRGHLEAETYEELNTFANRVQGFGIVVASPKEEGDLDFIEQADATRAAAVAVLRHYDHQRVNGRAAMTSPELRLAMEALRAQVTE